MKKGEFTDNDSEYDASVPLALVLVDDPAIKDTVASSVSNFGYQVDAAETAEEALNRLESFDYSTVILLAGFDGASDIRTCMVLKLGSV